MDLSGGEYINILIHNYLSNQASEKELKELLMWINQSDDNRKKFIEYRRIWMLTSQAQPRGKFNKAKYEELKNLAQKMGGDEKSIKIISITPLQKFIRIAAVLLLLISIGATIAWRVTSNRLNTFTTREIAHQINVPKGGKSEVILPDGTQVILNAGSSLNYSANYGFSDRNVILKGEGYFNVKTNPAMPFIVDAYGLKIKAFGTTFNVKAYPEEKIITTTLVEGIVRIEGEGVNLTMNPKQKVTYVKAEQRQEISKGIKTEDPVKKDIQIKPAENIEEQQTSLTSNVNTFELTAWKDNRLFFNAEKLQNLAVLLERKFDVAIQIESEELLNYKFTGTFHQETLEQILDIINLSAPIKYSIYKGIVRINLDVKRKAVFKEMIKN